MCVIRRRGFKERWIIFKKKKTRERSGTAGITATSFNRRRKERWITSSKMKAHGVSRTAEIPASETLDVLSVPESESVVPDRPRSSVPNLVNDRDNQLQEPERDDTASSAAADTLAQECSDIVKRLQPATSMQALRPAITLRTPKEVFKDVMEDEEFLSQLSDLQISNLTTREQNLHEVSPSCDCAKAGLQGMDL